MKRLILILIALTFVFVACQPKPAAATPGVNSSTYQATWTANTEADLDGYYLYWKSGTAAFNNTNRIRIAKTATVQVLTGTVPANTVIALTAVDAAGDESGYSNQVPFVVDGTAPSSPAGLAVVPVP
jgi:hypothetical protein